MSARLLFYSFYYLIMLLRQSCYNKHSGILYNKIGGESDMFLSGTTAQCDCPFKITVHKKCKLSMER